MDSSEPNLLLTQEEREYIEQKRRPWSPLTANILRLIITLLVLCGIANLFFSYRSAHHMGIGFSDLIHAMNVGREQRYSGRLLNTVGIFQIALIQWALALLVFFSYKGRLRQIPTYSHIAEVLVGAGAWEGHSGEPTPLNEKTRKYLKNTTSKSSRNSWKVLWFVVGSFLFVAGASLYVGIQVLQEYGLSGWQMFQAFWGYFEPDKQYSGYYVFGIEQIGSTFNFLLLAVIDWEQIASLRTAYRYNSRIVQILTQTGIYSP